MNWFAQTRADWIGEMLRIYGFINRVHLERKFRVSGKQATKDLVAYTEAHPGAMEYCPRAKRYNAK